MEEYLVHHGILGQKWGVRRYQNADGTLTPAGKKHYEKADAKFIKKNESRIYKKTYARSRKELNKFIKDNPNLTYISFNKKMAEIMNKNIGDIPAPSGRVIRYVAKRGSTGVYTALADKNYNLDQVRNGVWDSGRVGYKKTRVEVTTRK